MNIAAWIGRTILKNPHVTQRELAKELQISLGNVNGQLKEMLKDNLLAPMDGGGYLLTDKGMEFMKRFKVDNAIIIAAGFGSRCVPLTYDTPKGLLEVFGERMVERQIKHLHEAGISDITIVVGYLKEKFEYLIDKYDVKLVYNPEYVNKNTLATLYRVRHLLGNTYVLVSDNWIRENIYHEYEPAAWYCCSYLEGYTSHEWYPVTDRKNRMIDLIEGGADAPAMNGPAYFDREFTEKLMPYLEKYYNTPGTENLYWEQIVKDHLLEFNLYCNTPPRDTVYEFECLEELRAFDEKYRDRSDNPFLKCISRIFEVPENEITNFECMKAGLTNRSFLFTVKGESYVFRVPGVGTEKFINRAEEKACYDVLGPLNIPDEVIYFDKDTGYKISRYYKNSHICDPFNKEEVARCMNFLRKFHQIDVTVAHSFDLEECLNFYEGLCEPLNAIKFEDYAETRAKINELLLLLKNYNRPKTLSHLDSNYTNFLFLENGDLRLIDWEYGGMSDPFIDLALFLTHPYYNEEQIEEVIDMYFGRPLSKDERICLYANISIVTLYNTIWAEYKTAQGQIIGEYTLIMYRYAKTYYKKTNELLM